MASIEESSKFTTNNLNQRVEIYDAVPSILEDGTRVIKYKRNCARWSNVSIINLKNENENGEEIRRVTSYRIVMRCKNDLISTETLLKYKNKFLIQSAPPIELSNQMILIDCYALSKAVETM